MSTFTPLNVEPEIDVEEDVDDSKEIQVEEALKLYQTALKLHVQGPAFYDEAEEAYDALFASEIFKYPESQSEAKRLAQLNDLDESDDEDDVDGPPPPAGIEAAPNTLPQLLYLSYKNHGQFLVDRVAHQIALEKKRNPNFVFEHDKDAREATREPLDFFAEALDRDETDSDLWRRTARICRLLGSRRLLRFCTEAALLSESADGALDPDAFGIESVFAQAELGSVLDELEDDLSKLTLQTILKKARSISKSKRKIMDPFPKLPEPTVKLQSSIIASSKVRTVQVPERSWTAIGKCLLTRRKQDASSGAKLPFASGCQLVIPSNRRATVDSMDSISPQKLVAAESLMKSRTATNVSAEQGLDDGDESKEAERSETAIEPTDSDAQGRDPTAEAQKGLTGEDVVVSPTEEKPEPQTKSRRESEARPSLKRNSESAGLGDGGEPSRSRSKRLRARQETTVAIEEDVDPEEQKKQFEKQLKQHIDGDNWLFQTVDKFCSKIEIYSAGSIESFRESFSPDSTPKAPDSNGLLKPVFMDFKDLLASWDLNKSNLLLHGRGSGASVTLIGAADDSGLASFLEHSKPNAKLETEQALLSDQGISDFVDDTGSAWQDVSQLAMQWVEHLLEPKLDASDMVQDQSPPSKYTSFVWPITLKETFCQLIVEEDENLFPALQNLVFEHGARSTKFSATENQKSRFNEHVALMELVQGLFELHLDIYGKITTASSKVDQPTRTLQRDRTKRWAGLASQAVSKHVDVEDQDAQSRAIAYRYLWSTVIYVSLVDPSSREHVLVCLRDLKHTLQDAGEPTYLLPNNSVMPEISVEAAEREITRLTTMDFFLSIFDPTSEDAVATIESLEPILMEAASIQGSTNDAEELLEQEVKEHEEARQDSETDGLSPTKPPVSRNQKLSDFLSKASASLRLSLWHRLKTAYEEIEYPPMVLLCNVKSMEIILTELKGSRYSKEAKEDRSANFLVWIRNVSDILTSSLDIIRRENSSLDCMDEEHLPAAISIIVDITKVLHTFALWEDSVRVGQSQAPSQASGAANAYKSAMNLLRELQPKCWSILYHLMKEATVQNPGTYADPDPSTTLAYYLAAVHNAFSLREYCKVGKKAFLKMMKTELIQLNPQDGGDWSLDLAQIVYDLYGLKIYYKSSWIIEHGCNGDQIDRGSALELIDHFMAEVNKTNIRDVLRSDMRIASEKMQAVIGTPRSGSTTTNSAHQAFNRRLLLAYLKSPVNPMELYRSVRGIGALEVMPVVTDYAAIAKKKWYFLQGHLLLAKYHTQKRTGPGDDEELDDAVNFFKLDLDFDAESWETWYRLAQTYDAKIDEAITWDSKDINNPESDLVSLQKSAIHCYSMAVAVSVRTADDSDNTLSKLSELYSDFGIRIYASSRPPLNMKVFSLAEYQRFYNSELKGTYKQEPFQEMREIAAWRLASLLFRKATRLKPDSWVNWYMLGKCLWKLFRNSDSATTDKAELLNAFKKAVEHVPMKRDSKHPDKDPVLEPHYKIVSIAYKLLKAGRVTFDEAAELLQHSPHTRKVARSEFDDSKQYILQALKVLRAADKSNWHHRMVARVAHIHYDDDPTNSENAEIAKRELTQQIFTKTMTIQVWRPEYERPGRHFVYKTNYTRFFVQLLGQLEDRASVDLLAKRVRKKQNEFIAHTDLWTEVVTIYLRLLRAHGPIPENHADPVFKSNLSFESFVLNASRLETWAHSQLSLGNAMLDLLRETMELKKLSGVYIKPGIIDELVEDTYARIYEQNVPALAAKADEAENRERMRIDRMLMNDAPEPEPEPAASADPSTTATGRPKTIGRGEIRRRAEALVARLLAPSQARRGGKTREPGSPTAARGGFRPSRKSFGATDKDGAGRGEHEGGEGAAPSVHDSADDESELSEPPPDDEEDENEEEKDLTPAPVMFPGLMRKGKYAGSTVDGTEDEDMATADEVQAVPNESDETSKGKQDEGSAKNTVKQESGQTTIAVVIPAAKAE